MAAATVTCPRGRVAAFLVLIRDPVRCPTRHMGGSLRTASCEWQTALPSTASRFRNATAATASTPQSRHRLFGVPPHKDAPEGPKVLWKGRPWGRVRERCPSGLGPERGSSTWANRTVRDIRGRAANCWQASVH